MNVNSIPADFPRSGANLGSISGAQPKIVGRLVNGSFVDGLTEAELYVRFDNCSDLVEQLTRYCRRKLGEIPGMSVEKLLPKVRKASETKGWDVSPAEFDWIMLKLSERLKPGM
jgi:hypothetical protein